ncbi:hypothetical protein AB0P17_13530 [Streptomyces sp. NPDC088124]|uniref:hypothetical protein n=1 Tax=Streptomyces sp. NPDC088124 TaxID=3154654 RepID=UPI00341708EA
MDSIVRFFEPLLRLLLPPAGRHRAAVAPSSACSGRYKAPGHRSAVVFVHACRSLPRAEYSALLLPYPRAEFERWKRAERRLRHRELLLADSAEVV